MQQEFFSFVVPIYNDGILAQAFCIEFDKIMKQYFHTQELVSTLELIFIDDGSTNDSLERLKQLTTHYPYIEVIEFSKNFGQHNALSCGYDVCRGDYLMFMDVDMEDPLDQVPYILDRIVQKDVDAVFGIRPETKNKSLSIIGSKIIKSFLRWSTQLDFPTNHSTLRCFNRLFIEHFKKLPEKSRYIPGMEFWLGFKHAFVPVTHQKRLDGGSSYNFSKKFLLALEAIISFTDLPIRATMFCGFGLSILGILMTIILILNKLIFNTMMHGYTSIICVLLVGFGSIIFAVGMIGLYVGKILLEIKNRPLYIIRQKYK